MATTKYKAGTDQIDLENQTADISKDSSKLTDNDDESTSKCTKKRLLIITVAVLVVLLIVGLTLGLVLTSKKTKDDNNEIIDDVIDKPTSRIDCLPWLKNQSDDEMLKSECSKQMSCKYQLTSDLNIPACYLDNDSFKQQILENKSTPLGESYTLRLDDKASNIVKIDVEYLHDSVLRFKVLLIIQYIE